MAKKIAPDEDELFSSIIDGIKPLTQDKLFFNHQLQSKKVIEEQNHQREIRDYFSDTYQPHLPDEGPMRWSRDDIDKHELKRLRRGDYQPELLLDLHGMRQTEAKLELSALLTACIKQRSQCCCVMHGHGTGVLKQNIPMWLAQHPEVLAFHRAPKEWGGAAALLVLLDIDRADPMDFR